MEKDVSYNSLANKICKYHHKKDFVVKDGSYFRANDSRFIKRYKCTSCNKRFSNSTHSLAYKQKKRRVNHKLYHLLSSGISMRRAALILNIHRTTVKRKLVYLARKARLTQSELLAKFRNNKVENVQFDDLITIEHTKLKPLTVSLAVDKKSRFILGAEVSIIPAFGHLAKLSRKKYGERKNNHLKGLNRLFEKIKSSISKKGTFESDEHNLYPQIVQKYFPNATHKRYKGGRSCVAGQGELKKQHWDPIFILNHTCAMFRGNINRLIRKTWCTSKSIEMLKNHIDIYIEFHNTVLITK